MKKTIGDRAASRAKAVPLAADAAEAGEAFPVYEGIGVYAESGLHASLKAHFAGEAGRFEVPLEGKIVDLVRMGPRGEELVEIQTRRFDKIRDKVLALAEGHRVRIVHPVPVELRIARISPETGEVLSERKSPKSGDLWSVFDELMRAPALMVARNVTIEVVLVRCREIRCRDGGGSWRRRGDRTLSRDLEEVLGTRVFSKPSDWLRLLPRDLPPPWSSASLGEALGIGAERARRVLYSYAAAGLIVPAGKDGRRKLYGASPAPVRSKSKKNLNMKERS